MIGTNWIREQGMQDALLVNALRKRGMDDVPLWQRKFPKRDAAMKHWNDLTPRRYATEITDGMDFDIYCTGPDLPAMVPAETAFPADIPKDPKWVGTYQIVVAAPLVAFDICWQVDVPLRIMTFSRGDWEDELIALRSAGQNKVGVP